MSESRIDFEAALDDVVAITASARSATGGWRTICVRERRRVGSDRIGPLSALDLDEDATRVGAVVREISRRAAPDVDTLVFGLFDGIDDGSGGYAGYHVAGVASHGRSADDFMRDPWTPERHFLRSEALDSIVAVAAAAPPDTRALLEYSLCFGAAALTSRFAVAGIARRRVVVAFDDDHSRPPPAGARRFVEIIATVRRTAEVSLSSAVPKLLCAC